MQDPTFGWETESGQQPQEQLVVRKRVCPRWLRDELLGQRMFTEECSDAEELGL